MILYHQPLKILFLSGFAVWGLLCCSHVSSDCRDLFLWGATWTNQGTVLRTTSARRCGKANPLRLHLMCGLWDAFSSRFARCKSLFPEIASQKSRRGIWAQSVSGVSGQFVAQDVWSSCCMLDYVCISRVLPLSKSYSIIFSLSLFFVIQQPYGESPHFHSFSVSSEISSIGIEDKKHTVEYKTI